MNNISLYNLIESLPESLQREVRDFVEFLKYKSSKKEKKKSKREFGCLKGKIKMADNFDDPLDEFKDYM